MKNIIPWVGIVLVVLSIAIAINSVRLVYIQYQIKELKTIDRMNIELNKDHVVTIKKLANNQDYIMNQINLLQSNAPVECLKNHKELLEKYLDLLIKYDALLNEVKKLKENNKILEVKK